MIASFWLTDPGIASVKRASGRVSSLRYQIQALRLFLAASDRKDELYFKDISTSTHPIHVATRENRTILQSPRGHRFSSPPSPT